MRGDRSGYTLAEALVALLVAGVLTACLAVVLGVVGRVALRHAEAAAAAETERTVPAILGPELRNVTAADVRFAADSVRLRAFRGRGVVCESGPGSLTLDWTGARLPDPDKDSALVISAAGETAFRVTGVAASDACSSGSVRLALDRADLPDAPLVALVFETGAYSIATSAFRYRLGSAGRQPLTEENLSIAGSALERVRHVGIAAAARVTLKSTEARRAPAVAWLLGMPQGAAQP